MEEAADFQDWELLLGPDAGVAVSALPSATADVSLGPAGDSGGVIKLDYFAFDNDSRPPRRLSSSDGHREGGSLSDSDGPTWVEPNSAFGFPDEPSKEGLGLAVPDPGGFWALGESSGVEETKPHDQVNNEIYSCVSSRLEEVFQGVDSNVCEGEGEGAYLGGSGGIDAGGEEPGELDSGYSPEITVAPDSPGDSDLQNLQVAKGEKTGMVWWKLPVEFLKFCVFRIRPAWSISIAVALLGVVMLGRRLYKKKPKSRSIPLKVSLDDKRVSQFMVRASRLNEAFSVVKRVPVIRTTLPGAGVTPWPMVALR